MIKTILQDLGNKIVSTTLNEINNKLHKEHDQATEDKKIYTDVIAKKYKSRAICRAKFYFTKFDGKRFKWSAICVSRLSTSG